MNVMLETRPRTSRAVLAGLVALLALVAAAALSALPAHASSTLTVTTTADGALAHAGVECPAVSGNECTLRAAVQTANADADVGVIEVPAGTYELTFVPADNEAASGDLFLDSADVRIEGAGMGETIVDAGWRADGSDDGIEDRVFRIDGGEVTISDLTVTGGNTRSADSGQLRYGGGVFATRGAVLTLDHVEISGNRSAGSNSGGGGLATQHGSTEVTIVDSEITDNEVASWDGGALRLSSTGATHTIVNTVIAGNDAARDGGAIFLEQGHVDIDASSIVHNTAQEAGGGLYAYNETVASLTNTTVSSNTTDGGPTSGSGAVHVADTGSVAALTNATVAWNDGAAAIFADDAEIDVANSIVDHTDLACDEANGSIITSGGHNLVTDGSCGFSASGDIENGQSGLLPLTQDDLPVHGMTVYSDARDAGPSDPADHPATDQRGVERPQGAASDIGAVELEHAQLSGRVDVEVPGDNPPLAGATVELIHAPSGSTVDTAATDSDGEYSFGEVAPTDFTIEYSANGYDPDTRSWLPVEGSRTSIVLPLTPTATADLGVEVADTDGTAIEDATVTIAPVDIDPVDWDGTAEETDATGAVSFDGVPAGTYDIHVDAAGYQSAVETSLLLHDGASDTIGFDLAPAPAETYRIAGDDRVATAAEIAVETFDQADTALLATGRDAADALTATPLAAAVQGPLLLTLGTEEIEDDVTAALDELAVDEVIIIGQTAAVPTWVASDLGDAGYDVERVGGANRYETAALIAGEIESHSGPFDDALLAASSSSDPAVGWPDALSAGSYAVTGGLTPVLLTHPEVLPDDTAAVLDGLDLVEIVGGPVAVSDDVATDVGDLASAVDRIAGADRYETSIALAQAAVDEGADSDHVWAATGTNWPDGLAAGAATVDGGGVLVLVDGIDPDRGTVTHDWLADEQPQVVRVAGGPAAVSGAVFDRIDDR